jgi:periplasmic protein TonB
MPKAPAITPNDRFAFTLFVSLVLNALVVLGISFMPSDPNEDTMPPTLEVVLVPTRSDQAPEKADFYAQHNQQGSGEAEERVRTQTPSPSPVTTADDSGSPSFMPELKRQPKPENTEREILTAKHADDAVVTEKEQKPETPELKNPSAAELVAISQQIARLNAELGEQLQAYAKKPRQKFLSAANTKEYKFASYIVDWERKVEQIGSLNFPDEAKRRNLSGELMLDVGINIDGTIFDAQIRRSSGYKVLDDAALRIVHLAAPYQRLPASIRQDTDVLHITRTWQFLPGGRLDTK